MQSRSRSPAGLFLQGAAAFTSALGPSTKPAPQAVPNSAGSERPKLAAPANACDCHMHIYDAARFPPLRPASRMQVNASVAEYRLLQQRNGTSRVVIVTPAVYATDNRVTLDAIAPARRQRARRRRDPSRRHRCRAQGPGGWRHPRHPLHPVRSRDRDHDDRHDRAAVAAGRTISAGTCRSTCGATRSSRPRACGGGCRRPSCSTTSGACRSRPASTIPAFGIIRRLIDKGRTWVKISGAYLDTKIGPPGYADVTKVAQAFVKAAPERMVWGSDWPHPTEKDKPDDAVLFDLLAEWAPDEATRRRVLVSNPETLYGFARSS